MPTKLASVILTCFNTQPHGGGCLIYSRFACSHKMFQHTAARRRLHAYKIGKRNINLFQHTAARRRLRLQALAILQIC